MVIVPPHRSALRREGWFASVPLLLFAVVLYNVVAWSGSLTGGSIPDTLARSFAVDMPAQGARWVVSVGDIAIWCALILLFVEILRATGSGRASIINHGLSIGVFVVCLAEFLLFEAFATSVFFTLTLMTLLDVIAGFVISIITARRDFSVQ